MQKSSINSMLSYISILLIACLLPFAILVPVYAEEHLTRVNIWAKGIQWSPLVSYESISVTIIGPNGFSYHESYPVGAVPMFELTKPLSDGDYTYELRPQFSFQPKSRNDGLFQLQAGNNPMPVQYGHFRIVNNSISVPSTSQETSLAARKSSSTGKNPGAPFFTYAEDLIVQGSLCTGLDCTAGESFGFDTIRLKENNLRIRFEDTSSTTGFATNDWQITVNDSASGGGNYFSVDDIDGAKTPFKIMAGAPTNTLFVGNNGKIGIKTATPLLDVHILSSDTPSVRLDQDNSGGWTPQAWDIAGNESNFFVRDVTAGSRLPFRIQPGAPTSSLSIKSDGKIGIGTWSPGYPLELDTTGSNAAFVAKRTDGATNFMNATAAYSQFGSATNHPVRILVNSLWKMTINSDSSISMANGANLTAGGTWTNASSRELKENITGLTRDQASAVLAELNPVKFNYKANKSEKHVGFIAEDVPELVATTDRKGLSAMDIVAVLTRVVKDQKQIIEDQNKIISEISDQLSGLKARIIRLEGKDISALK